MAGLSATDVEFFTKVTNDISVKYFSAQVKLSRINVLLLAGTLASATRSLHWTARGREEEEGEETGFDTVALYLTQGQNIWHSGIIFNTVPQYFNSRKFHTGTQYVTQWHNILHRDTIIDTVHCCGIIFDTGTKSLTHWHNGLGHQLGNFSTTLGTMPKYVNYGQICQICIFGCTFGRAKYGQVGCPWKDLAKCSSDALVLGQ